MNATQKIEFIVNWLRDYANDANRNFVIGVSGGVDSAVVSTLCAMSGVDTHVVSLPILQSPDQHNLSLSHCKWLESKYNNITHHTIDLTYAFTVLKANLSKYDSDLGWANTRSRLRMVTLYQIATYTKSLVVGTGNKVEDFGVGFFTKYGDGGVDLSPIADLTKTQVRELARELGVSSDIIAAPPTDGLWSDGRTDEKQLGATYEELEWAMTWQGDYDMLDRHRQNVYNTYMKFNLQNQHKMNPIPVCYLPKDDVNES